MGNSFVFELGAPVKMLLSEEAGHVIGRAEYTDHINQYRVRYLAGDGRQVEDWFSEEAIVHDLTRDQSAA